MTIEAIEKRTSSEKEKERQKERQYEDESEKEKEEKSNSVVSNSESYGESGEYNARLLRPLRLLPRLPRWLVAVMILTSGSKMPDPPSLIRGVLIFLGTPPGHSSPPRSSPGPAAIEVMARVGDNRDEKAMMARRRRIRPLEVLLWSCIIDYDGGS